MPNIDINQLPRWPTGRAPGSHIVRWCINIKGCNGSGKSTIPLMLWGRSREWYYITCSDYPKKPVGLFLADYNIVILGLYETACGGCDALANTGVVKDLLKRLWKKDVNILYEGVIVGDIKSTFYEIMKGFSAIHRRHVSFCFMGTSLSECFLRIKGRQEAKGQMDKQINKELVRAKYKNSCTQLKYYLAQGDVNCQVLDTRGTKADVTDRFVNLYGLDPDIPF